MSASEPPGAGLSRALRVRTADLRTAAPAAGVWVLAAVLVGATDAALPVGLASIASALVGYLLLRRGVSVTGSLLLTTALLVGLVTVAVVVGEQRRHPPALPDDGRSHVVRVVLDRDLERGARSVTGTMTSVGEADGLRVPVRVVPDADDRPARAAAGAVVRGAGSVERDEAGSPTAAVVFLRGSVAVDPPTGLPAATDRARRAFVAVTSELPEPGAALLRGLAIGDRSGLDPGTEAAMETVALTHLTAVSGANCAVIVGLVVLLGRACGLSRSVRACIAVGFLLDFVVLVRPDPSIVRATVMAVVVLVVHLSGRPVRGVPLIALAVVGMLVVDPWYARSFAFALSVLATSGIIVLAPPLTDFLSRRLWSPVAAALAVPTAAQLSCWPVTVLLAPALPTYAVPANLLTEPLAPVVTVVGLGACLLAPLWPPGASVLAGIAWAPASAVGVVAHTAAALPGSSAPWPVGVGGVVLAVLACGCVAVAVFVAAPHRVRLLCAAAVVVLVGTAIVAVPRLVVRGSVPADWTIAACDVGQGDALLVRSGSAVALVDTGDDPELLRTCLGLLGVDRIAVLVLTHFDRDHVGAVGAVAGAVTTALVGPVGRAADDGVVRSLRDAGVDVRRAAVGTAVGLGGTRLGTEWPLAGSSAAGNDASIVTRVVPGADCAGCPSALLLGDLGESAQRRMRGAGGAEGPVDVVKVSHHGSADQDPALYRALGARVALIGVGADNSYGHPTRAILDVLEASGTAVFRTDLHGTVAVAPGADGPRVWTERVPDDVGAAHRRAGIVPPSHVGVARARPGAAATARVVGSVVSRRIDIASGARPAAAPEGPHARQEARARRREDRPGPVVRRPARPGRARHRARGVPRGPRGRRPP